MPIKEHQNPQSTTETLKWETDSNIIVGNLTPFTSIDRSFRAKVNKETVLLDETLNLMNLDLYRTFHTNIIAYIFCLSTHGTFSRIDHMLRHKQIFSKFKIKIISEIFSDHSGMT